MSNEEGLVIGDEKELVLTAYEEDESTVRDLTGTTVHFLFKLNGGALQTKAASVDAGTGGVARYRFTASDFSTWLNEPGELRYWMRVTDGLSRVQYQYRERRIPVREAPS